MHVFSSLHIVELGVFVLFNNVFWFFSWCHLLTMKESACFTLLDFEPPEDPTLRQGNVPSISKMLNYIIKARHRWKKFSESGSCSDNRIESAVEELEVLFVYHTCQQEDVGIADKNVIKKIIEDCKHGKCRDHMENHESSAYQETVNLYDAYKMLQDLGKKEAGTDPALKGLLEVDSYILSTHERLMRGLSMKTPGGLFSTDVRQTIADGELHQYPKFETQTEARDAVLRIVDRYNMLCFSIKDQEHQDEYLFVRNVFKCVVWLFYELLSLHPFGDGNGRLCRLILNYAMNVIMPFPVPLRDILSSTRDAYLHAVITPRKSDGRPTELIRLLIESTYNCCKKFLKILRVGAVEQSNLCSLTRVRNKSTVTILGHDTKTGSSCISLKMSKIGFYVTDELMVTVLFIEVRDRLVMTDVQPMIVYVLRKHTESFYEVVIFDRCSSETLTAVLEFLVDIYKNSCDEFLVAVRNSGHLMHVFESFMHFFRSVIVYSTKMISCVAQSSVRLRAGSVMKQLWSGTC